MRRSGGKNIASMKSRRNRIADHPVSIADLAGVLQAVALDHRSDDPVVRQHEVLALPRFHHNCFSVSTHTRVYDHQKNSSGRVVWCYASKKTRRFFNLEWSHLMGDIRKPNLRRNTEDDRPANGYRIVRGAKIRHKHNDR